MSDSLLGKLVWYELVTTDVKAAEAFYTEIVGWTVTPFPGLGQPYDVLNNAAGKGMGGVMKIPDGMNYPPHWVMYIGTPNIDDTIAQIGRLGGMTLSPPIDAPEVGRMRTMLDPQGAMFSLIQPASQERSADAAPGIGDGSWRELYTTDAQAAMNFYREVFGWQPTGEFDMGPGMGMYYMFGRSFPLGGMMTKTKEMEQVPTAWGIYFRVPDPDAAAEKVKAKGGQVINGPMDVPGGDRIVQCIDPQGGAFNLHRPPPQPAA
jgi:predicted enzyme related to lactoylglutathione lyase